MLYRVVLEQEEDGGYCVSCPALSGCHSQGDSRDQALSNIREAIDLYLESLKARNMPVPASDVVQEYEFVEV